MTRHFDLRQMPVQAMLCIVAICALSGCHHRMAPATRPPVLQAPDAPPVTPESPSMVSPPPESISTAPSIKVTQTKPRRTPKKTNSKTPQPAVADNAPLSEGASAPSAESSIGELSAGGDSTSKTQEAAALIVSCEQRASKLPQGSGGPQSTVRKVRYFLKEAQQALGTGDGEGALTLATKAKLLLDDLVKEEEK